MYGIKDAFPNLPERIEGLRDLAFNLWWSWHPEGRELFKQLSRTGWYLSRQNPVRMLNSLETSVLKSASEDPHFLRHYDAVMARFSITTDPSASWFCANVGDASQRTFAYFSAEWGLHHALPFYAGGLGFLAGDFLKECSDLGLPMVGVGFMYPAGYLRQNITPDGWQAGACEIMDRENAPIRRVRDRDGQPLIVKVPVIEPALYLQVWKVEVGKASLYLLDTSSDRNDPSNRCISDRLYTGDQEQRLRQEIVLGIGGIGILKAMGIDFSVLHLNEGHPAFAILERVRDLVAKGMTFERAFEKARATTLFTTHTPVPAGHDVFSFQLMEKYFRPYIGELGLEWQQFMKMGTDPKDPRGFNMTVFALHSSAYHNAVSKRHMEVSRQMWRHLWPDLPDRAIPIDYVTNGVHVPSWIDRTLGDVILNKYLGRDWLENHDNQAVWGLLEDIPDDVLWRNHTRMKRRLINFIRDRARIKWFSQGSTDCRLPMASGVLLDESTLTLGFARRFASYKRATLLLQDVERLKRLLNDTWRPVQIIYAGKAHPDDDQSKGLLQQVFDASRNPQFGGRIAFVEDYDEQLAQYLVHGVDVWVNNPIPPMEACGTSGMKATLNGVPQLSILDGWWMEGYNGSNGWAYEGAYGQDRDQRDSQALYDILENRVVPLYYETDDRGIPVGWIRTMREAMRVSGPQFSARRMVKEYTNRFYRKCMDEVIRS
ncbi:MAG: Carbohydrate phosphorylase [Methanosaeta sp. PtaB.Bin039]|nr:MAG: Carbohydrate phosphorylase [Methanosaeta sp. PtaB.Bin039]OPY47125.1 MAG: Carbohydrate phosphorylase [Methanosaeta sp. PtaU1.Bin028]HOT07801.1 alpha-glucan family phosphorylase [Methanotrichaceae archaeon]HQF16405.1 alpha-glucan family phosphorylase [Methanotrichaceae archaeon]HQI90981.1 alpha-glucan family phosphorylase [Methanotrichaceae archaeon]